MNTLLIVDDDPWISSMLKLQLEPLGCRILTADNSAQALLQLKQYQVDVVLADYFMPDQVGTDFLRNVKQQYPQTVRMILSGRPDLNLFAQAINDGVVDKFFLKPWDEEKLKEHLQQAFRQCTLQQRYHATKAMIDEVSSGIALLDLQGVIESHNPAFNRQLQSHDKLTGQQLQQLSALHDITLPPLDEWPGSGIPLLIAQQHYLIQIKPIFDNSSQQTKYLLNLNPALHHGALLNEVEQLNFYDAVTELASLGLMIAQFPQLRALAERNHWAMAVAYLRLDNLFELTDQYGKNSVDQILKTLSQNMSEQLREMDLICRFDDSTLVILFTKIKSLEDLPVIASKLYKHASQAIALGDAAITLNVSLGLSHYPQQSEQLHKLIELARKAAIAQASNKNSYQISAEDSQSPPQRHKQIDILHSAEQLESFHGIYTANPLMHALIERVSKIAHYDDSVFIFGETGTGKELFAHAIHAQSQRAEQPFVAINCANFNAQLLESQLFGHRKGAFTGATKDQPGLLLAADGGTLFLDEVTDIPAEVQAKLLRVLQEREYIPVGETQPRSFDVRIISASSTRIIDAVEQGRFRIDLQYRLEVIPLTLPALRERECDIVRLFTLFLTQAVATHGERLQALSVTQELMFFLQHYSWPGNIRELHNACAYIATMMSEMPVDLTCLPERIRQQPLEPHSTATGNDKLDMQTLRNTLDAHHGNKSAAARTLGISRMTLWRKMKSFGLA